MRVRTARVELHQAAGAQALFDRAVEQHLAWLLGTGRVYADLEKVARQHGYHVWVPEQTVPDASPDFWVAVRSDLIDEEGRVETPAYATFETTRPGLGTLGFAKDREARFLDKHDERVTAKLTNFSNTEDFDYTEVLYTVIALKD